MANSFYIIVAIIIIVSVIGSIVKSGADNKRTQYRQSPPPSSQGDKGGFANKEKPPINKRSYGENLTAHSTPPKGQYKSGECLYGKQYGRKSQRRMRRALL